MTLRRGPSVAGIRVAQAIRVAIGRQSRNQRLSHRVDVLLRVKGELVPSSCPITIVNFSRTGLAVLSEVMFRSGDRLEFRVSAIRGPSVWLSAAAVHSQSRPGSPGLYLTGFVFRPARGGGLVPEDAIRQLIAAVAPAGTQI